MTDFAISAAAGIAPTRRAETLAIEEFCALSRAFAAGVEVIEKPLLDNQLALKVRELLDAAA